MVRFFSQPIWLVGFRPFFTVALISGALFPLLWAAAFSGLIQLPEGGVSPLQWHAHEMFFGFGWAILGGFLLTASKNWVKIRGLHGGPLAIAVALWLVERVLIVNPLGLPSSIVALCLNMSVVYVGGYVIWSLVRFRKNDTFSDNYFFIVSLPLFLVAKNMILWPDLFAHGWIMATGLFRLAFVMMFERTMTQFMKNAMKVNLLRNKFLDFSIKVLALISVFASFMPVTAAVVVLSLFALVFGVRWLLWKPWVGFRRFDIGVMYLGYFGIILHLALEAMRISGTLAATGDVATHTFTFLTMGIVIPSMLIRICQGHTGRPLVFATSDRVAISIMGIAAFFRLVAPQFWPEQYLRWISVSALGWSVCFALIGWRLIPFLWQPRIDGREH